MMESPEAALTGDACDHRSRILLGVDSTVYFYLCEVCGEVLVAQGGRTWRVAPRP